jgi:hypothetical protein
VIINSIQVKAYYVISCSIFIFFTQNDLNTNKKKRKRVIISCYYHLNRASVMFRLKCLIQYKITKHFTLITSLFWWLEYELLYKKKQVYLYNIPLFQVINILIIHNYIYIVYTRAHRSIWFLIINNQPSTRDIRVLYKLLVISIFSFL